MLNRRKNTPEFKAEAVELVISSGRAIAQVVPEIGVNEGPLGNWVRAWKEEHPHAVAEGPGSVECAQFKALQAENAELKREIEFLGKSQRLLRCEATINDYYSLIWQEKANYPTDWMYRKLTVSRASHYRWTKPATLTLT